MSQELADLLWKRLRPFLAKRDFDGVRFDLQAKHIFWGATLLAMIWAYFIWSHIHAPSSFSAHVSKENSLISKRRFESLRARAHAPAAICNHDNLDFKQSWKYFIGRFSSEQLVLPPIDSHPKHLGMDKVFKRIHKILADEHREIFSFFPEFEVQVAIEDYSLKPERSSDPTCPRLHFQMVGNKHNKTLFPDWNFGNWFHIGLENFDEFALGIEQEGAKPWTEDLAFWIGNPTTHGTRPVLLDLAKKNPQRIRALDLHFVNDKPTVPWVALKDHCKYRYLIDMGGIGFSGRFKLLPYCRRPLLVQSREWHTWADNTFEPFEHYLPVETDLSDLVERIQWLDDHPREAEEMAERAFLNAKKHVTFEAACRQGASMILDALSSQLQQFK